MSNIYDGIIEIAVDGQPVQPDIILAQRSGVKEGIITYATEVRFGFHLNEADEISFDVYRNYDDLDLRHANEEQVLQDKERNDIVAASGFDITTFEKNDVWDKIKDFKLVYVPKYKKWYEIQVTIDEDNATCKHVNGIQLQEAELSQLNLYETEINTEEDINSDNYEVYTDENGNTWGTVFYDPKNPNRSLLNRILHDKAPHYSIYHVDESLRNIQRTFEFNGESILDALKKIAEEVECVFVFGESNSVKTSNGSSGGGDDEGGGGGDDDDPPISMQVATATSTPTSASNSISFTGLSGEPTSFAVCSASNLSTGASPWKMAAVVYDGTNVIGQTIRNTSGSQVTYDGSGFSQSYSDGTLTITGTGTNFQANQYKLVYTYGGTADNIDTKNVQVGSGATSITFTGLEDEPEYFSCIFKSNFSTSNGYQRVISVVYDGTNTYGMEMDSSAKAASHWSYTYSNGSLTIRSNGTNQGGYFHQPGNYQLTYAVAGEEVVQETPEPEEPTTTDDEPTVIQSDNGTIYRTISAYDLNDYCFDCGKRDVFTKGVCTKCGSTNIKYGYGEDTEIFVSVENLADSISYETDVDSVKNCFRLVAGDDLMTVTIENCNPAGSNYIWYLPPEMREDMSDELKEKLAQYDDMYEEYNTTKYYNLDANAVAKYNNIVNKYRAYDPTIPLIETPIIGYSNLMNVYYNVMDLEGYLQTSMMPDAPNVADTTAEIEIGKLTKSTMSPIGTENLSIMSASSAYSAVLSYAKVYIDTSRYQVKILSSSYENAVWTGSIYVERYTDDEDNATVQLEIEFNEDAETFLEQKIEKVMKNIKVNAIGVIELFKQEDSKFAQTIKQYSLDELKNLELVCDACRDVLIEQGHSDPSDGLYEEMYLPYYRKTILIQTEIKTREDDLKVLYTEDSNDGLLNKLQALRSSTMSTLNFENFLGEELWTELSSFRREDAYENSNYISDELSNAELIAKAQQFLEVANKEIVKSATLQHTITSNMKNLLLIRDSAYERPTEAIVDDDGNFIVSSYDEYIATYTPPFSPIIRKFAIGNYIHLECDESIYRLRMTDWTIDFSDLDNFDVKFSDVIRSGDVVSDIESIITSAKSISSSYSYTARQADKGNKGYHLINNIATNGLDLTNTRIINTASTQDVIINQNGILLRTKNDFDDGYSDEQIKIINNGLYYTNDGWRTASAGVGHFAYYDPEDGSVKDGYGVIADTIVGNIILGNEVGIYNEGGSIAINENGITITSSSDAQNSLFTLQKEVADNEYVKYMYVDDKGNFTLNTASISIGDTTLGTALSDAEKTATNYLYYSPEVGLVVTPNTENISQLFNTQITATGMNIRNGEAVLAHYGSYVTVGNEKDTHAYIDNDSFEIRDGKNKPSFVVGSYGYTTYATQNITGNGGYSQVCEVNDTVGSIINIWIDGRYFDGEYIDFVGMRVDNDQYSFDGNKVIISLSDQTMEISNISIEYNVKNNSPSALQFGDTINGNPGLYSSALGRNVKANAVGSFAVGLGTVANSENQFVEGKYNLIDSKNKYAHIIGNGSSDSNRANLFGIAWSGDIDTVGNINMALNKQIFGYNTSGIRQEALQPCNSNGNLVLGYGGYANGSGATNIYGDTINLLSNNPTYARQRITQPIETGSVTAASGWTINSGDGVVRRNGNIVQIKIFIKRSSSSYTPSSYTTVATIASGYRPSVGSVASCIQTDGFNRAECLINESGEIKIRHFGTSSDVAITTSMTLEIGATYIVNA